MQITTTVRYCLTHGSEWPALKSLRITKAGVVLEKKEPFYTVLVGMSTGAVTMKNWKFLKTLKIELLYAPAISLLGMYLDKTRI